MSIIKPRGRFAGNEVVNRTRKHLEPAELVALFKILAPDPFWNAYFRLQYYYGCRVSEVAVILKEDIEFTEEKILVRRLKKKQFMWMRKRPDGQWEVAKRDPITRTRSKDAVKRKVSDGFSEHVYGLPKLLAQVLRPVSRLVPDENPYFFGSRLKATHEAKERMAQIRRQESGWCAVSRMAADRVFRDAATRAGLPRRLRRTHVLRHTRATLLLAEGAKEEHVQHLLAHSSITTTRGYLGAAQDLRLRAEVQGELGSGALGLGELSEGATEGVVDGKNKGRTFAASSEEK